MIPMEYQMNKIEANKNLADLKHKLVALDGIMQAGFKLTNLYETDYPISARQKETQALNIR
jgi:hypothetical protein